MDSVWRLPAYSVDIFLKRGGCTEDEGEFGLYAEVRHDGSRLKTLFAVI